MFYISFISIIVCALMYERYKKASVIIALLILASMIIFRYGVGADYFSYNNIFQVTEKYGFKQSLSYLPRVEIGYIFLNALFAGVGFSFHTSYAIMSLIVLVFFALWINDNSNNSGMSLLILFSLFYFTWTLSAIRQGLVISIGLYFLFNPKKDLSVIKKSVIIALLFSIHSYALVLILTFIMESKYLTKQNLLRLFLISIVFNLLPLKLIFDSLHIVPGVSNFAYKISATQSLISNASIIRVILFLLIYVCYEFLSENKSMKYFANLFLLGVSIHFFTLFLPIAPGRIFSLFYLSIVILLPSILERVEPHSKPLAGAMLVFFSGFFFYKELNTLVDQAGLNNESKFVSFPMIQNKDSLTFDKYDYFTSKQRMDDLEELNAFSQTIMDNIRLYTVPVAGDSFFTLDTPFVTKKVIVNQHGKVLDLQRIHYPGTAYGNYIQSDEIKNGISIRKYFDVFTQDLVSLDVVLPDIKANYENGTYSTQIVPKEFKDLSADIQKLFEYPGEVSTLEMTRVSIPFEYRVLKVVYYGHDYFLLLDSQEQLLFNEIFSSVTSFDTGGFIETTTLFTDRVYHFENGLIWINEGGNFLDKY